MPEEREEARKERRRMVRVRFRFLVGSLKASQRILKVLRGLVC